MKKMNRFLTALTLAILVSSCSEPPGQVAAQQPIVTDELLRVGSIAIYQSDLDYHLQEKHGGRSDEASREQALAELAERARFTQAALDAHLDRDPVVRAETARLLTSRLRETALHPKLEVAAAAPIPEARLRELYDAQSTKFVSEEKRQLAVLWLSPSSDPARVKSYTEKLAKARDWFIDESDLADHPDKGFSILSVDHSEHAATRFKGGVLGWFEKEANPTDWLQAVAEIGYSIGEVGGLSPVVTHPEGFFLVRWMALKPAVQRSFESARSGLERAERDRLRASLEAEFTATFGSKRE